MLCVRCGVRFAVCDALLHTAASQKGGAGRRKPRQAITIDTAEEEDHTSLPTLVPQPGLDRHLEVRSHILCVQSFVKVPNREVLALAQRAICDPLFNHAPANRRGDQSNRRHRDCRVLRRSLGQLLGQDLGKVPTVGMVGRTRADVET
jgi:hypothetical protein